MFVSIFDKADGRFAGPYPIFNSLLGGNSDGKTTL
jgi:hypothetical protein